ncbi:MAG: hypothetical protein M9894_38495 [Planctomycetes bacterium]|nr:hypothetical protein [Planctomycetota bacterium]
MLLSALRPRAGPGRCPYCREDLAPGDAAVACPGCRVEQHDDCLREGGRCATLGCEGVARPAPAPDACARCGERAVHGAGRLLLRCTRPTCHAWHHVRCVASATCTTCGDLLAPDVSVAQAVVWMAVVPFVVALVVVVGFGAALRAGHLPLDPEGVVAPLLGVALMLLTPPVLIGGYAGVVTARHRPRPATTKKTKRKG